MFNKIYRKSTQDRLNKKFKLLSISYNPIRFMNYRIIMSLVTFLILIVFSNKGYIYGPIGFLIVYVLFEYIIDYKIKLRKEKLNYESIFFFQVLVVTLESGRNLQSGLELTCKYIDSEISDEFKKSLKEVKLGRSLIESLNNMKDRIPSEEINTVILNITQSTMFGNNVIESLNNQVNYLRDKKLLDIKSKINKMPLKISIISVLFMIPIILLLVLAPVLISYLIKI